MRPNKTFVPRTIAVAVSLLFAPQSLLANPTGAQVVNGSVSIAQPNATTLNITNSPGAIINWQGFSIGANEVTRFIQQSASSAVLNRVVGPDISSIQGQLLSNGRVFLINPAGIIVGPNAMIDTAGFVGSALNLSNADFLAGKLRFSGDATSGPVINQGWIRTSFGGNVLLVAPNVENSGLIQTPGGELILAAGQKLTVSSMEQGGVQFEVQAPTDSVLNVGKLLADGGAVGVFAGTLKHSGEIRANALVRDAAGEVVLKAANDIQVAAGSVTSASGKAGGSITIASSNGLARVAGTVAATGSEGKGGGVTITGDRVTAADGALIDVSGAAGGGQILLGGDYQGANAAVRNATTTFVGNATLRADATTQGDGGRIIVWGNDSTRFYGGLSAQGGDAGGNGGFAEVSGKNNLLFEGTANLSAPKGMLGTLLLDPLDLYVFDKGVNSTTGGGLTSTIVDEVSDFPSSAVTVSPATLAGIAGNVNLYASRYMRISNDVTLTTAGQALTATVGKYVAPALPDPNALDVGNTPNQLDIAANITTKNGAITMNAPLIQTFQTVPTTKFTITGGAIALTSGTNLNTSALTVDAGAGVVTLAVGTDPSNFMQLSSVTGGTVTANAPSFISMSNVTTGAGALTLNSTGSSVNTSNIVSTGGTVNINAPASSIRTDNITGGGAAVTLAAKSSINTGVIDTAGAVTLSTTAGSISTTVNNASKVTASAANSFNSASVNINSTTALNADSVNVTVTDCNFSASCPGATISLTASGNINVGTLTANAPATTNNATVFNNLITRSVNLTSNGGSILAASPTSLITATDATLTTQQGSGGGVGTVATALKVDVERSLNLTANGDFNVLATGSGPTQVNAQLGVAKTGATYTGTLSRSAGGLTLNASATDTTVTVANLTATGFTQRLYNQNPSITLGVSNGALTVNTISVPEGDTRPDDPLFTIPAYKTAALPVSISSRDALTINNYTRVTTGASLPKATTFSSSTGIVTLGTIAAGKDTLNVTASGTGSIVATSLSTAGNVTLTANGGDITVGSVDTSSGIGNVTLNASTTAGAIKALNDNVGLEVTSGGTVSATAKTIGTSTFANPLDLAGSSITLTSSNATGGAIGFAGKPLIANTQTLTLNASSTTTNPPNANGASFNVSSGALALTTLNVTANAQAVGVAGPATVTTEAGKGVYNFVSDGTNFTLNLGTLATANQFANGALNFTSNNGDITLGAADMGAAGGSLSITARGGSILGGATLDGKGAINLSAGQSTNGAIAKVIVGNVGAINRPSSLTIAAGNSGVSPSFATRQGTVTTGAIEAGNVNINAVQGNITVGNIGAVARAGNVSLTATESGGTGAIQTGNITASSLSTASRLNTTKTGNIDATTSVNVTSENTVTLGNVNAQSLTVGPQFTGSRPAITTNAITGVNTINLFGSTTTINGSVTGDPTGTGQLFIGASGGPLLITGKSVVAGNGSTIAIDAQDSTNPFVFATLDAGAKGTVSVLNPGGIQQTGGVGITGATVALTASGTGKVINRTDGDGKLDVFGSGALTINSAGPVAIDGNGSMLTSLNLGRTQAPSAGAFALTNLGGGQVVTLGGAADLALTVQSAASPLDFTLSYSAPASNIALAGAGINTGGGLVNVSVSNGGFTGTTGGIVTGGAKGGGAVTLSANGPISTGAISTAPTGAGTGGAINVTGSGPAGSVAVSGNLTTGVGGDVINLTSNQSSVTRSGASTINSDNSVFISASGGSIGAAGTPLLITTPSATLTANRVSSVGGDVFATLTNTSNLTLSGDNSFAVGSNTAFTNLSVATRGTGTGTLNLTSPGQTYTFARATVDLFGVPLTDTFQVVAASGAANATFRATDGDLYVGGGSFATSNLTLAASGATRDVKLQGTAATPLTLNNTTQNIGDSNTRDVLVSGVVTLTGATQNITANRSITVQAAQGNVAISGTDQTIQSTGFSSFGQISFKGGTAANQTVTVTGSNTQLIQTTDSTGAAGIQVLGGDGAGSSALIVYTGTGTQKVQAGGNVLIAGGVGANSLAEIRTGSGSQFVSSELNLNVTGGAGAGAAARIINTGSGSQQVGESRQLPFSSPSPYQTDNMTVSAGAGNDAIAEINATGLQQVYVRNGTLTLQAGGGTNAFARIDNSATSEQLIGCATYVVGCGGGVTILNVLAGTGTGAYSRITNTGAQRVTASSQINLTGSTTNASATITGAGQDIRTTSGTTTLLAGAGNSANALIQSATTQNLQGGFKLTGGGSAGAVATAQVTAAGNQTISGSGVINLSGGAGINSLARLSSGGDQNISYESMTLVGGSGAGSLVEVAATGTQSLSGSSFLQLIAGGLPPSGLPVAGAHATLQGNSQSIFNAGTITINGGTGTGVGAASDAVIRNLGGNQSVSGNQVTVLGGNAFSTAGIVNQGAGTQTISGGSGIILNNNPPVTASASTIIQNTAATLQTLTSNSGGLSLTNQGAGLLSVTSAGTQTVTTSSGGLSLTNQGAGLLSVTSAGTQTVTTSFIDVTTAAGSTGNAVLSAAGNQWLRTTNGKPNPAGSMRVAALGTGLANIESGASQLIELDYPQQMQPAGLDGSLTVGGAAAAGKSRIGAVDQTVFAKSVLVQGPNAATQSELKSSGKQVISVLNGNLRVLGGSGNNSLAQIDPVDQNILVNGGVGVIGGSGVNALAQITSQGTQTLFATNGSILVQGGSGPGANASITASGVQSLSGSGGVNVLNGTGGTASISGGAAPVSNNGASSLSSTPSGTVIALNDTQSGVVTEAEPEDNPNNNDPLRRAPICY